MPIINGRWVELGSSVGHSTASSTRSSSSSQKPKKKHEVHEMSSSELAKRREHRRALAQGAFPAPVIGKRQRKENRARVDAKHWEMLEKLTGPLKDSEGRSTAFLQYGGFRQAEVEALLLQRSRGRY